MTRRLTLLIGLAPLLASCQALLPADPVAPERPGERWQGMVTQQDGQNWFSPCGGQRRFQLTDAAEVLAELQSPQSFIDMRARLNETTLPGADGQLSFTRLYRLEAEGPGCSDPGFARAILRAGGNEPGWRVEVSNQGMLVERMGEQPQALPYLEEHLPEGRLSFSSEADGQQIDLWIAPQRCQDTASGTVTPLTATFRHGEDTLRGCAYLGGARSD